MSLSISQTYTAIGPGLTSSFLASGGTSPYTYAVRLGGAGGAIISSTGIYTAPSAVGSTPQALYDTIVATDANGATGTAGILVADPLILFCDIIETSMGLANGRVYLWDQKIMQPTDSGLFIPVHVINPKCFGNSTEYDYSGGGANEVQTAFMNVQLQLDIKSRSTEALFRKEEVIQALHSSYSQQQQEANGFRIFPVPESMVNRSVPDGAAIPYQFALTCVIQYSKTKVTPVGYFTTFAQPTVTYEA